MWLFITQNYMPACLTITIPQQQEGRYCIFFH